jgi:hypothetical protein
MQPFIEEGHLLSRAFPAVEYVLLPAVGAGVVLLSAVLGFVGLEHISNA